MNLFLRDEALQLSCQKRRKRKGNLVRRRNNFPKFLHFCLISNVKQGSLLGASELTWQKND